MTAANIGFLTKIGVYPYDYVSSIDKFSESQLTATKIWIMKMSQTKITNTHKMFGKHLIVGQVKIITTFISIQMYYFLPTFFKTFVKLVWNIIYKLKGDIGEYPIPQYRTKKWQIPKYHIANRLNTDTAYFNYIYNWFHILMVASL